MSCLAVLSDIHGNLPALEAVLSALEEERVDRVLCCGDLVGYGPWPGRVLARLQEIGALSVKGNHDAATCETLPLNALCQSAQSAITWTRSNLSFEEIDYLERLPQSHTEDGFVVVHGSLRGPVWEYILDPWVAKESFIMLHQPLGLFGHSHIQGGFIQREGRVVPLDQRKKEVKLHPEARYLINPGSVGQPRDGDPRAAYAIVDLNRGKIHLKRVPYDIVAVIRKVQQAGLPSELGERLLIGR